MITVDRLQLSKILQTEAQKNLSGLDPSLERLLLCIRLRAKRRIAWLRKLWSEEGEPGGKLAVTHAEIDTYLENRDSPQAEAAWITSNASIRQWNYQLAKVEEEMATDKESLIARLYEIFGLNKEESALFKTCLALSIDPSLARIYAYLHDHAGRGYATEQLAQHLFGYGHHALWNPDSVLGRWDLIKEKDVGPGEPPQLICDPVIRDWLQGKGYHDQALAGIAKIRLPLKPLRNLPVDETVAIIKRTMNTKNPVSLRLCITGTPGSGRRTLAAAISAGIGLSLLEIDSDRIIDDHEWQKIFIRAQRRAFLDHCAIAWCGQNALNRLWPQTVPFFPLQFQICEAGQMPQPIPAIIDHYIEIPHLSLDERRELWRRLVPVSSAWPREAFDKLIEQYRVNIGEINSVARRKVQTTKEADALIRHAYRNRLGNLAQLLECPFQWEDLVVSKTLREVLEDLTFEAHERIAFWERPEARRLFPQGRGLLALFSGPPGTGKTMAAQIIAANLGLDLYRIDLSTVVSKYVGETSKNLERILSNAAQIDIVLLFDEADALFGKRTDIKDAHDRFANTDTGYLLQAIENYRGVALLATNKKGNIDPAFIRRIRYALEFPKPDAGQREQIWRKVISELAGPAGPERLNALANDLKTLAQGLELTGAQIKFAILSAIFAAKRDKKPLAIDHLLRGIDRELSKEGRALSDLEKEKLFRR